MRMIDMGSQRGGLQIISTPTSVDCAREVRYRKSFRSLVEFMVPCCGFQPPPSSSSSSSSSSTSSSDDNDSIFSDTPTTSTSTTTTGTFFGYRKGRVSFCIQDNTKSTPLLLLEFAVPTAFLAREMKHGLLRIALDSCCTNDKTRGGKSSLYNVPAWSMYCNGRKVGYALRRKMTTIDVSVLKLMQSVSAGAGVLPPIKDSSHTANGHGGDVDDDLLYLRATFKRVIGSTDSHSFHMINPVGSSGQELSIFLLRKS